MGSRQGIRIAAASLEQVAISSHHQRSLSSSSWSVRRLSPLPTARPLLLFRVPALASYPAPGLKRWCLIYERYTGVTVFRWSSIDALVYQRLDPVSPPPPSSSSSCVRGRECLRGRIVGRGPHHSRRVIWGLIFLAFNWFLGISELVKGPRMPT